MNVTIERHDRESNSGRKLVSNFSEKNVSTEKNEFWCQPHSEGSSCFRKELFFKPVHFSGSSFHEFIIEIFFPSIDFNEFDVIEDLISNFHSLVSGFSELHSVFSSKSRNHDVEE